MPNLTWRGPLSKCHPINFTSYILFCYASSTTNESTQTNLVTCHLFPVVMTSTPRHASNNLPQPVEIQILMVWLINTTYFLRILKKLNLILLVTCQWITSKKYWRLWWVNTWACNTVRWYWSQEFFPPIAASVFEKFKRNL